MALMVLLVVEEWQKLAFTGGIVGLITGLLTYMTARNKNAADAKNINVNTDVTQSKEQRDVAAFHEKEWEALAARYTILEKEYQKTLILIKQLNVTLLEIQVERDDIKRQYTLLKLQTGN